MRCVRWLLAALVTFGICHATASSAEPVKIRMAWTVVPFEVMPVLFTTQGVMKHLGTSYTVEFPHFQSSSSMFAPLASGDIDIASMSAFTFSAAIQRAGMNDLRIVADEYEDGVEGYLSGQFVVLKDGPVHKIEDLKGKIVASFGIGSSGDMASRLMLRRHGLEDKRDYTVIEANGNNMPAMLFEHKVDLINTTGFTAHDPDILAKTRPLFNRHEAFGGPSQETVIVGRTGFIEKNRAALVDYLEDELRALNWCLDPKNHAAAIALVAAFTKAPASRFESWMFTRDDEYRDPQGMPKLADFQRAIDVEHDFGLIQNPIDVNRYTDLSLVKEAAARLK
jgi:NitT/TauT family transport system substrate-binding protein